LGSFVLLTLLVVVEVAREPFPDALRAAPSTRSLRVLDRSGQLLTEVTPEGQRGAGVHVAELPPHVIAAVLAAEDARFYRHFGMDPWAVVRALGQAATQGRWVSGASTITQQLARNVVPRPRTLAGKWREMVIALRIERELDKDAILEEYLSRIQFGPRVRGLEGASRFYFDKPAARLDLAEAALLAALPRGPTLYDPKRSTTRAELRRNRILGRMLAAGALPREAIENALAQPIRLARTRRNDGAPHLVRALSQGKLVPGVSLTELREVRTTLDGKLQAEAEALTRATVERLGPNDASAAAVLVVDNGSREVLAYVGSPDFWSARGLGQNDGVRARRQPGSTLKPFVYATALDSLGYSAATLLPDIELHLPTPQGDYAPKNYDGRFHGPIRLRQALASSLNVPAVYTVQRAGVDRTLELLHRFGFASLDRAPSDYGAALALGDGEVTLAELAAAYSTLANDGQYQPLGYVTGGLSHGGQALHRDEPQRSRALPRMTALLLVDLLSDNAERESSFGRDSVLELPFPVAAKTGTSKGNRDNWTVGFTKEVTVAVWVGNFDGHPMLRSSGVTGAGPLFHDVMLAAMKSRSRATLVTTGDFAEAEICSLSGELATADCPHHRRERFAPGTLPRSSCSIHERVAVLGDTGLRAGPACPNAEERVFERYPALYRSWARKAGRPTAPERFDPRCPGTLATRASRPGVAYPFDGARFTLDPSIARERQRIVLAARTDDETGQLWFVLDGRRLGPFGAPHELSWQLETGAHELMVEAPGGKSDPVRFRVE
jgi:penicillin-binding protein 1C